MREGDEVCDGTDIGASTCGSQGFDAGTLACSGACDALDTSGCLVCEQAGESCAADPQGCCPGLACTDFGADLVICF
jgi:hypothetical protein